MKPKGYLRKIILQLVLKVAFVCTHNSCRSQIAEAICRLFASGVFQCFSAGTMPGDRIDPTAARLILERFDVDILQTQYPKQLSDIPPVDVVITMGCISGCPATPCVYHEDWGLSDPTGRTDQEYSEIIDVIEKRVLGLEERLSEAGLLRR